jgi:predicted NAD/FAD-dependent oxidoreductase
LVDSRGVSLGCFDRVIVSAPAEQTAELLAEFPTMNSRIAEIRMYPFWAAMATLPEPVTDRWVGAFLQDSFLKWSARNSSKPGRNADREILVMHATPEWTLANWESNPSQIADRMISEFNRVTGRKPQTPIDLQAHRWKYALPVDRSKSSSCFYDPSNGIAACGDWAMGSRVEGAFLSGMAAAGRILGSLASTPDDIPLRQR